jgi:microcystin degradation protein MlrC
MARIAVGGFQHETNTFAPLKATWADFERVDAWPPFVRGPQLIEAVEGFNIRSPALCWHCRRLVTTLYHCVGVLPPSWRRAKP